MVFSNTFKTIYWFILLLTLSFFLYQRYPSLINAETNWFDGIIFLVWISLALAPLFNNVEVFGLKLSRDIENLKKDVASEFASLRNEIKISTENNQTMNPQFMFGFPPPDSQLHDIEDRIKKEVQKAVNSIGASKNAEENYSIYKDPKYSDVEILFNARFSIEKEVRAIFDLSNIETGKKHVPLHKMLQLLTENDYLPSGIVIAIKEVYAVCSPAIHGLEVSEAQVEFVKNTAPNLISVLNGIRTRLDWE